MSKRWLIQKLLAAVFWPIKKLFVAVRWVLRRVFLKAKRRPILHLLYVTFFLTILLIIDHLTLKTFYPILSTAIAVCIAWVSLIMGAREVKKHTDEIVRKSEELNEDVKILVNKSKKFIQEKLSKLSGDVEKITSHLIEQGEQADPSPEDISQGERGLAVAEERLRQNTNDLWSLRLKANALFVVERYEEALQAFTKAIALNSDDADSWFGCGIAKDMLSRYEDALADFDEAIRLKPDDAVAWSIRGSAKCDIDRREDAIADFDEGIRLKPDYVKTWFNRGATKAELSRHKEAVADYDEVIRLKPNYADAWSNRGVVKCDIGRREEAIKDYNEVIRLKPDYAKAWVAVALPRKRLPAKSRRPQSPCTLGDILMIRFRRSIVCNRSRYAWVSLLMTPQNGRW